MKSFTEFKYYTVVFYPYIIYAQLEFICMILYTIKFSQHPILNCCLMQFVNSCI